MKLFVFFSSVWLALGSFASSAVIRENHHPYRNYGKSLVKKDRMVGAAAGAGIGQATNSPHEWGRGASGFGKRLGSGAAHYMVKDTIQRGVGGVLHEERNNYVRANRPGFMPKFKSAAQNTFWVKHKGSNKRYPAVGRISGDMGSGMVSRLWQPARLRTVSSGLSTGGISLGADFGYNLAREYIPPSKNKQRLAHVKAGKRSYTRRG